MWTLGAMLAKSAELAGSSASGSLFTINFVLGVMLLVRAPPHIAALNAMLNTSATRCCGRWLSSIAFAGGSREGHIDRLARSEHSCCISQRVIICDVRLRSRGIAVLDLGILRCVGAMGAQPQRVVPLAARVVGGACR